MGMGNFYPILPCKAGEGDREAVEGAVAVLCDRRPPPGHSAGPPPVARGEIRNGSASPSKGPQTVAP